MATVRSLFIFKHLRAEPNQMILHYRRGRLARKGAGLSYWFNPLSAAISQVPVEDCEATLLVRDRTADLQEVAVQLTVVYRFADPEKAATRSNFGVNIETGQWVDKPLERIAGFWAQRVREPVRSSLATLRIEDAVRGGVTMVRKSVAAAVLADEGVAAMGLAVVGVEVTAVTPSPEMAKALETPTRESIQQRADEAVFQRRALAVEKERAIKENELSTQIELARRQESLVQQQNASRLAEIQGKAAGEKLRVESEQQLADLAAAGYARDVRQRAAGDAEARRILGEADAAAEAARARAWGDTKPELVLGLAAQALASKLQNIEHVTITPDTLTPLISRIVRGASNP